ncbi:MAG: acetyl-CoA hydrolase/transferase C-terminal domain-containing protein [Pseudomonadota bacterium]|nr:acetyl-CoA hydrolase/transferase C-terminal domain-containing protein [Pseudomonadota bacterium]
MSITDLLQADQRIFVGAASNEPVSLLEELQTETLPQNLRFIQFPLGGMNSTDFTSFSPTASVETFFMTPALAKAEDPDRVLFKPMQMRWVYDYLCKDIDVAMIQVARDRMGTLRLGPNTDFIGAVLTSADVVLAELNTNIVAPAGAPMIPEGRIDLLVESARSVPEMAPAKIDAAAARIGTLVAGLIEDGDCLQTGIGAIPAAILGQLDDKNDLGLHGGLIDDGGMRLIRNGNLNGHRKPIDAGLHIAGIGLGTHALYEWLADTPQVIFRGANYTHEASAIARLPGFVSINSAVEIDLSGTINAEVAGGRQISGTGGSVDFMRGAKHAQGGRSIVAMNATARGGTVSRIVPKVEMATALRTDVDIVVTEHGIARIKNASRKERIEALINIAAPEFRDQLRSISNE